MGTPDQVWSSITRCWSMEPTGERIVEDIVALQRVLDMIIANKGCMVKDEFLWTGRRHCRAGDIVGLTILATSSESQS